MKQDWWKTYGFKKRKFSDFMKLYEVGDEGWIPAKEWTPELVNRTRSSVTPTQRARLSRSFKLISNGICTNEITLDTFMDSKDDEGKVRFAKYFPS
jgi:hypothetical protein